MTTELEHFIRNKKPVFKENPHWTMSDGYIYTKDATPLVLNEYKELLEPALTYFQQVWSSLQTEAQVLVVSNNDWMKLEHLSLPTIQTTNTEYMIVVLPQSNTWHNTSISEGYWQKYIVDNDITPLMRIHSHHILKAYQSYTDWSSLNSGTLEVVIGNINNDASYAYWLDIKGTNNKDTHWQLEDSTAQPVIVTVDRN